MILDYRITYQSTSGTNVIGNTLPEQSKTSKLFYDKIGGYYRKSSENKVVRSTELLIVVLRETGYANVSGIALNQLQGYCMFNFPMPAARRIL